MLTEDQVAAAVCLYLEQRGYKIVQRATGRERGVDIIAKNDNEHVEIEAKGAGSSDPQSARYGKEFNAGQVEDHVGRALVKTLRVVSAGKARAGIALPDNKQYRRQIQQVAAALDRVGIAVFWVRDDHTVHVESPWRV